MGLLSCNRDIRYAWGDDNSSGAATAAALDAI